MEEKDLYCCYLIKLNKMEIVGALFDLKSTLQYVSYAIFFSQTDNISTSANFCPEKRMCTKMRAITRLTLRFSFWLVDERIVIF